MIGLPYHRVRYYLSNSSKVNDLYLCHLKASMRFPISDPFKPYLAQFSHSTSVTDGQTTDGRQLMPIVRPLLKYWSTKNHKFLGRGA